VIAEPGGHDTSKRKHREEGCKATRRNKGEVKRTIESEVKKTKEDQTHSKVRRKKKENTHKKTYNERKK